MSARFNHSVAVKSDGTVWTWGNNSNGQIGDGSTTQRNSPVQVAGVSAAVSVTAGYFHTLSLSSDGSVKAWGSSLYGQIGDGATIQRTTPVTVAGISDIVEIKAGYAHSVALKADGTVWAWGLNNKGQIGDGTTTQRNSPVQIPGISGVISIAAGFYHTLALKSDGTVWAWGENTSGQIGDGTTIQRNSPVRVGTLDAVLSLSAGFGYSLALKTDGTVRAWGSNTYGQLGDGTTTQRNSPIAVGSMGNVVTVAAAFGSSMFLKADGKVWGCGMNSNGQLGDGTTIQRTTPVLVSGGLVGVAALALGNSHSLAVKADGTVWAWGFNTNGQLGSGNTNQTSTPGQTLIITGISAAQASRTQGAGRNGHGISLSAGELHSMSLNSKGEVWAWGANDRGQIGNGTTDFKPLPTKLPGISGVTVLAAGREHSLALKSDGKVWAWGANDQGQLGDGTTIDKTAPTLVPGLSEIVAIAAGSSHSLALKADGTLWVWGGNAKGQLGLGNTTTRLSPVALTGLTGVISLGAGSTHTLALRHDGTVWAWGGNDEGRLGDGSTIQRNAPVQVTGLSSVASVAGGDFHSVALKTDGTLWTWGVNTRGQLGNGGTVPALSPVQIPLLNGMVAIAAGRNHGAALSWNGSVRVWGANECGQAGVGSLFDQKTPVQIPDLPNVIALAAACDHNLTLTMDGGIVGWGKNSSSQLGDQIVFERAAPIKVIGVSDVVSLSAGINHTMARKSNGALLSWGYNDFGQLGSGSEGLRSMPTPIPALGQVLSQAGGATHTVIAKLDGTVWACGNNDSGQLGDGTTLQKNSLIQVSNLSSIARVAVGTAHSMALDSEGKVWTWGANTAGQLGDGGMLLRASPAKVLGLSDVSEIACGASHSLVLKSDGTVWAWGANTDGRLGDGSTIQRNSPVQVTGLDDIVAITAGGSHSLALKSDRTVWIWGGNSSGQLGNGTTTASSTPTQIPGLSEVVSITAGSSHTAVLLLDGTLMSWGANDSGQLGDGTKVRQLSPVVVDGNYGRFSLLTAGGDKTYVVKEDGTLFAWGLGAYGELANAFAAFTHKGVSVLGFNRVHPVPLLEISSPPSPSELATGSNIAIELQASVPNGQVAKAFFYADGILLKQDDTALFSLDYSPDTWGNIDITAVVVSSAGATSAPATLSLKTPYDYDQDGIPDWWEVRNGLSPTDPNDAPQLSPPPPQQIPLPSGGTDSDNDLISDAWELANGLDPNDSSDGALDFDRDGHTNQQEYQLGTDPRGAPNFQLRELGPLTGLSEAMLSNASLGDGASTPTGIMESVYFVGRPFSSADGGMRPAAWTVTHGASAGTTVPFVSHGSPSHTVFCAQASGGAALSSKSNPGSSSDLYYWRSPGMNPIQLSGAASANNISAMSGCRLSPLGNYLVGGRRRDGAPHYSSYESVFWKMPLTNGTQVAPVILQSPPGVRLASNMASLVNDYGFAVATGTDPTRKKVAILWKMNITGKSVSASSLPHPSGGVSSSVTGISNEPDPLIVGRSMIGNVDEKATAWRGNGVLEDLNIPPNVGFSAAAAVSPNGRRVAGTCRLMQDGVANYRVFTSTRNPTTSAWKFQVHGDPVLGAEIQSINNDGEIFGTATTSTTLGQAWTKFLWRHGKGHALDQVIPVHTGHLQNQISALNPQGTLLAKTTKNGAAMTVILTPDPDTDGDGLPDAWENQYQLDPLLKNNPATDSDSDTLSDLEEFRNGTHPRNPDSDGDGMKDGWEISWGFLPLDPSDAALDPDNDRVTNLRESQIGTTPTGIYRVVQRYADTASLGPVLYADDVGNLVFTGLSEFSNTTDSNGFEVFKTASQRRLLRAQDSDVLPALEDGTFDYYQSNGPTMWQRDSYGTDPVNGTVFGRVDRENWFTTSSVAPFFVPSGDIFFIPDVAINAEDEITWTPWSDVESNLRDPNQHGGTAPLGQTEYLDFSWPGPVSPSGTRRIYLSSVGESFVLNEHGGFEVKLSGSVGWTAVNDSGIAARIEALQVPASAGVPVLVLAKLFLSNGQYFEFPLPLGSSTSSVIVSLSNDGKVLFFNSVTNDQLALSIQYFLFDTYTGTIVRVRQPGFGDGYFTNLSLNNSRLLGNGSKPFQITPDGTCIRLEALRIKNSPTALPEPFGAFNPNEITPIHISSSGTITVSSINNQGQTDILQIIPHNDADNDGVPDDWEVAYGVTDGQGDEDGDGVNDADEFNIGTNPNNIDTDLDGYSDGEEIAVATSPLDSSSFPLKVTHTLPDHLVGNGLAYGHPAKQPLLLYLNQELPASFTTFSGPWLFDLNGTTTVPATGSTLILPGRKAIAFVPSGGTFKTWDDVAYGTPTYQIIFNAQSTGIPHLIPLTGTFTIASPEGSADRGPWASKVSPGRDYIDADPSQPLRVTWNEPLDPATVIPGNLSLVAEDGTVISSTVTFDYDRNANLMIITPVQLLAAATRYTVTLSTGFRNFTGKAQSVPHSWSFTTRPQRPAPSGTGPFVTTISPADFSFGIAPPSFISITFSENMDPATLISENIRIRGWLGNVLPGNLIYTVGTRTLVFTPAQPFTARTYFSIEFDYEKILNLPASGGPLLLQDTGNSVFATAPTGGTNPAGNAGGNNGNGAPGPLALAPIGLHYTWGKLFSEGESGGGSPSGNRALAYTPRSGCSVNIKLTDKKGGVSEKNLPANIEAIQVAESGDIAPATTVKITPIFVAGNKESDTLSEKKKCGVVVLPAAASPPLVSPPPGMTYLIFRETPPADGSSANPTVEYLGPFGTSAEARCATADGRGPQILYFVPVPMERSIQGVQNGDWNLLEGDYAKALPGQAMRLIAQDKYLSRYGPPLTSIDTFQWPAPDLGKIFKVFIGSTTPSIYEDVPPEDLAQQQIKFYRTKGGDTMAAKATFQIKIAGTATAAGEAIGRIRVDQPSSSFDLEIGEEKVRVAPNNSGAQVLMFGLFHKTSENGFRGVKFNGLVKTPPGWADGNWNYVQLIKSRRNYTYQGGAATHLGDGQTLKLDTVYPYSTIFSADGTPKDDFTCGDTPRDPLTGTPPPNQQSTPKTQIEVHESFETFIMFKPPGQDTFYVPLRRAAWRWGGTVMSSNNWTPVAGPESPNSDTTGVEHFDHPQWGDNTKSDTEIANP